MLIQLRKQRLNTKSTCLVIDLLCCEQGNRLSDREGLGFLLHTRLAVDGYGLRPRT